MDAFALRDSIIPDYERFAVSSNLGGICASFRRRERRAW